MNMPEKVKNKAIEKTKNRGNNKKSKGLNKVWIKILLYISLHHIEIVQHTKQSNSKYNTVCMLHSYAEIWTFFKGRKGTKRECQPKHFQQMLGHLGIYKYSGDGGAVSRM